MATTTLVKTPRTIVAPQTLSAGAAAVRGVVDLRTAQGGVLTIKISNGATTLGNPCICKILIAHNSGATPASGPAGSDWKTIQSFSGGVAASTSTEKMFIIDPSIMHLQVEFFGNTTGGVDIEAYLSEITSAVTV